MGDFGGTRLPDVSERLRLPGAAQVLFRLHQLGILRRQCWKYAGELSRGQLQSSAAVLRQGSWQPTNDPPSQAKNPIMLTEKIRNAPQLSFDMPQWGEEDSDWFHLLPILTPAFPNQNTCANVVESTMFAIRREISRGTVPRNFCVAA